MTCSRIAALVAVAPPAWACDREELMTMNLLLLLLLKKKVVLLFCLFITLEVYTIGRGILENSFFIGWGGS
jgi:hypothetical protein